MRIALVIFSLSSGGAERVMSILANYWAERGENISLITVDSGEADFYELDTRIKRISLNLKDVSTTYWLALKNNWNRIRSLRAKIKQYDPDVVISFMDKMSVVTLIATRLLSVPVIVSEHIDPRQMPPDGIWKLLRRMTYSWANAVVVLTDELRTVLSAFVSETRLRVIPNPAIPATMNRNSAPLFELPPRYVVAMGRLHPQKGFDYLLQAFSKCRHHGWSLVIIGEGEQREYLEDLAQQLGILERVYFTGRIDDPAPVLRKAEIFVLSSRFEGFPMAILEAMSCGLPVISFNCPTGPSEIISDGVDGILVPPKNVNALSEAINDLISDDSKRNCLSRNAPDVVNRFSLESIVDKWDKLINDVMY